MRFYASVVVIGYFRASCSRVASRAAWVFSGVFPVLFLLSEAKTSFLPCSYKRRWSIVAPHPSGTLSASKLPFSFVFGYGYALVGYFCGCD